jgi:uncharacterized membrane protein YbaN (DUF454 family)
MLLKTLTSALLILAVNLIAQRAPALGGWLAATPLISLLSVVWLALDRAPNATIAQFLVGVLLGLVPTALFLAVFALALKRGATLPLSALSGLLVWVAITVIARRTGLLGT